jgi:hypothetical protein
MTSDLDAKGPAVHLNEHNPERDITSPQAAPQPGNDPSGIAEVERLRAALFEIAGMHELSVYDYSPTTRWWMHQKVARDALGVTSAEFNEESL